MHETWARGDNRKLKLKKNKEFEKIRNLKKKNEKIKLRTFTVHLSSDRNDEECPAVHED